ncbi:MAG: SDR family oxidoreductase [Spirochaetaceae bacterium]
MSKYGITGSTGQLGTLVIQKLLEFDIPASSIVAMVRDKSKAFHLEQLGVEVRIADYNNPNTLKVAFMGIDKLLLISGNEVGKRIPQHKNVVIAAVDAGVKLLTYTSVFKADTTTNPVAPEHKETEKLIRESGLPSIILRNNWYTENYIKDVELAGKDGFIESSVKNGKVSSVSRIDYAEAAAKALTEDGHTGKVYELAGDAWDFSQFAEFATEIYGKKIIFNSVSSETRAKSLTSAGLQEGTIGFVLALEKSINAGSLEGNSSDLEKLLGRKPQSFITGLKSSLS